MTTEVDPQERPLVAARGGLRLPKVRRTAGAPRARRTAGAAQRTGELTYRDAGPERPAPPAPRTPRWEERRQAKEESAAEAMGLLNQIAAHLGGLLNLQKAAPSSDVLYTGTRIIPAAGFDTLEWAFNFAALTVTNLSTSAVTVTSDGPASSGTAPGAGVGVHTIGAGAERTFAARGHSLTIYGAAGALVCLQVYTRQRAPYASSVVGAGTAAAPVRVEQVAPGLQSALIIGSPGAGADFSVNPSPGAPWQPVAFYGQLVTSAVVANRLVSLRLTTPVPQILFQSPVPVVVPASNTLQLSAGQGFGNNAVSAGAVIAGVVGLSEGGWLPAGTLLKSATLNIDVADQWGSLALLYETLV